MVLAASTATIPVGKRIITKKTATPVRVRVTSRSRVSRAATATGPSAAPHQTGPTPDRYREIQESLISKGYMQQGSATGTWDQSSMDAMRKYQADQKMDPTGKITAKALITLGLGPRDESFPTTTK